ncbi:MAG TPA: TIGR03435 family protein [Terracidiphilus sp.]|nr:TIGR03435 family protein [Terracidiphilus sp.]
MRKTGLRPGPRAPGPCVRTRDFFFAPVVEGRLFAFMLDPMRLLRFVVVGVFLSAALPAPSQPSQPAFEVASVRPSAQTVGPDYNNQVSWTPDRFTAKNVTLKRLIADAWNLQLNQVIGPAWLDRNEYEIEARPAADAAKEQRTLMLQSLLAERFGLKQHIETRAMRVYELTVAKNGPKIKPTADEASHPGAGFHFHGEMRQFADLLAVQFSIPAPERPDVPVKAGGPVIPVIDKTGLRGTYDFGVDLRPELGTDEFAAWRRALNEQLGLTIESRRGDVEVLVVDDAAKIPSAN